MNIELKRRVLRAPFAAILICCAGLLTAGLISSRPCRAAEIPAWLDDAISSWNTEHADTPMQFVSIKDSYVWYSMPKKAEIGHKQIRDGVKNLVLANNYVPLKEDEAVTVGRPPVASGKPREKKCWT